ncbi:hypothetical protein ASPACDRAFT_117024 [Aspergillus aculeatus ATCC 16872]|uniref:Uncharacterized protein n=1 Tax=Aspergillus aculeatus (strain ATCC 16872 / CBS 172.66 / WB 5094) TaxID=690307 RepID=A0A1L9WX89_ASPA1|nr:uncharacterized protein ASPACDRAFT_117024 [Aspergillus aculeatus ATCC 16872]OJK00686.1 hypothetical protein ASPACDRAFT_117024 [Aspergillus aculeatus ATCC 16872]
MGFRLSVLVAFMAQERRIVLSDVEHTAKREMLWYHAMNTRIMCIAFRQQSSRLPSADDSCWIIASTIRCKATG